MVKRKTADFYKKNKKSYKKKLQTDKEVNARPEQKKKRAEANKARRKAKRNGKAVAGKDYDHATGRFISSSVNRGRTGEGARKRKR